MKHVEDIQNQENILQDKRLMITAMGSGSGKTVMTCGLMRAFTNRGISVEGYKCGPDYIDPMFHQRVLGIPSRNLDMYLQGRDGVARTLDGQRADLAIIEGAMGYYDGLNGTPEASAWAVADAQDIPAVLVVRPAGSSVTLAAQILGMMHFRRPSHIVGLLLTDCKPALYEHLRSILARETGLPVLGYLPPMPEADLPSRHLGLVTAAEIADLAARFDAIAGAIEAHVDLDALLDLASTVQNTTTAQAADTEGQPCDAVRRSDDDSHTAIGANRTVRADIASIENIHHRCRIAVARDAAFSFYYQDNLDLLRAVGAELVYFSPLEDAALPEVDGLYLGGGYPELHMEELSRNETIRESIRQAIADGMPTVAECGGFLYLQQALVDENHLKCSMAGVLPGTGYRTDRLQRFGYLTLTTERDSLLLRTGEIVPAHEFHYWDCTDCGSDLQARKASGKAWRCGYVSKTLYAAFPHFHFGGETPMAERFVEAAERYHREK